jgi:hypothetical protein
MKLLLTLLLFLGTFNIVSQESTEKANRSKSITSNLNNEIEAFSPDKRLLNEDIWQRVSVNRFECKLLRLAVELGNDEYLLMEMDGNKRLLFKHKQYSSVSKAIMTGNWTFPNLKKPPEI